MANKKSAAGVADQFGLDESSVRYWLEKHGYYYNRSKQEWLPEKKQSNQGEVAGVKEGEEERKPDKEDKGDYWIIRSGERNFEISKAKYRQIRRDYSGENHLTINEICRKYKLPRWKFIILKNAFGFTHDDVPYTDEEMLNNDPEELVDRELQRRKDQYFQKLREKEVRSMKKELRKYREEEYLLNKCHDAVTEHMENFLREFERPDLPVHKKNNAPLLLEVPVVDLHLSKLCWEPETGENFDRNIAEERFMKVIDDVIARVKDRNISKILFPVGNDFFNFDDMQGNTTRGTRQDNDSRWPKMFSVGVELLTKAINKLAQLADVDAFVVPGNHDRQTSYYAMMYLSAYYKTSPAVDVDTSPKTRKYRQFGKCLIGFSHMDQEKSRIYGNMQQEVPELWGQTEYREWHGAHLHAEKVNEKHGVIVRNLSAITARDAWHYEKGYKSLPKSQSFLWHKEKGLRNILVTTI